MIRFCEGLFKGTLMAKDSDTVHYSVDLWFTDLHDVEIGIYQNSRHRAKSMQFTKDMDIFGEVKQDGERVGLIAYREGLWKENEGMDRRLVIKLFSASMNWKATMDLMMGRSLQLTHGAGKFPVTSFNVNVSNHDQMIQVERSANKWIGFPEKFSFFVLRDNKPYFYRLQRTWISFGVDYKLYDQSNNQIGYLDGKLINIGGKWNVSIHKDHSDSQLNSVIQLFCAMLKFNDDCRKHIDHLARDIRDGQMEPELESQETDFYLNPRRAR